ncbi:hypothetical protein [Nonomuraea maritima]|uniref:hypothetical protein n=1 Tax=Nonomuraea maritima TaxID=683260 RepID=UPI0037108BAB
MSKPHTRAELAKTFFIKGTQVAAALFLSGLKGLIFFAAIRNYDSDVAAAYGVAITVTLAVSMLGAGLNVVAVQKLAGVDVRDDSRERRERLCVLGAAAVSSTLLLTISMVAAGVVLTFITGGLTSLFFWFRMPGVFLIPIQGIVTGALVASGRESATLRTSMENVALHASAALVLPWLSLSPSAALMAIALPLKSYGLVGGRMAKAPSKKIRSDERVHLFGMVIAGLLLPLSLTMLVAPTAMVHLIGLETARGGAALAVSLAGVQLLLEPLAGFGSAVLKVLIGPAAAMTSLLISMAGVALPLISVLLLSGKLSVASLWGTLLVARLCFAVQVLWRYRVWRNNALAPAPAT